MEARRCTFDGQHCDVGRKARIERAQRPLRGGAAQHLDRDDVGERVNSRIRAACDGELADLVVERGEHVAENTLDRPLPRLASEAVEGAAVVGQGHLQQHVRRP